ncbi:MAG TPA: hypothetical protein VL728_13340 [Cyclobacteriaceae bacterium]|nr:hypothetical protein [Cyclobacteriaceae bacterium]
MKFFLTAKHWQIFILILLILILSEIKFDTNPTLTMTINLAGTILYFIWPMVVGHELQNYLPKKIELNYTFFMINGFILILGLVGGAIIAGGEEIHFNGIAAIPFFYLFFALFYYFSFPGRTMRTIENGKETGLSESIGDFFLTFFLPLGIWFLQPRINRIIEAEETSGTE